MSQKDSCRRHVEMVDMLQTREKVNKRFRWPLLVGHGPVDCCDPGQGTRCLLFFILAALEAAWVNRAR